MTGRSRRNSGRRSRAAAAAAEPERLQKVMARRLSISRRMADQMIVDGRVTVNGKVAIEGLRVTGAEHISLDGEPVAAEAFRRRVILYHKVAGEECSSRPGQSRISIFDRLPPPGGGKWITVGRLDVSTAGLLLLTTDGALANRLMHPSGGFDREYMVRLDRMPDDETLQRVRQGVQLEDGPAGFADLVMGPEPSGRNCWCCVTLLEGRNRLIHRIWSTEGLQVSRLIRVRFGPIELPRSLRRGQWRELTAPEITALDDWPQADPIQPPTPRSPRAQ